MTDLRDLIPGEYRARGRHIEAAWMEICFATMPSPEQFAARRLMFFSGAAFMYDVIMKIADARNGEKATREDLKFLNQLCEELGTFAEQALLESETAGNA